jgi:hypothetical protein
MAAILFLPFKSPTEVFLTSSLDRFIRKGHKNVLFMQKRSRLELRSGFQMVRKPDTKSKHEQTQVCKDRTV